LRYGLAAGYRQGLVVVGHVLEPFFYEKVPWNLFHGFQHQGIESKFTGQFFYKEPSLSFLP